MKRNTNWRKSEKLNEEEVRGYYLAGDPAKQHDYFAMVVLERINNSIKLVAYRELQLDYTIVANYIESLNKKYRFYKIFIDETGIGNVFIDMLKSKGLNVEGIKLSNSKKVEIIETVIRLMQEGRLKLPKKGADELKSQLQEQERDLTQSGLIRFTNPSNLHDDLFWAFCIGVYRIKQIIDLGSSEPILVTSNWSDRENDVYGYLDRPSITFIDYAVYRPGEGVEYGYY